MVKIEIRECIKWSLTTGQKQWKIINSQAQKVVAVAYRRWYFTRGSNCKVLTRKIVVFWIGSHLWKVVAYKRWSHMEVRLYSETPPYSHLGNTVISLLQPLFSAAWQKPPNIIL